MKELQVEIKDSTSWKRVLNAARRTVGKEDLDKEPRDAWKLKVLKAEHSPIRLKEYDILVRNVRQWVTVHFVRHHIGIEKFVRTQREDRNEEVIKRDDLPQGSLNDMQMSCNAQALINISRKRLCLGCPSPETREVWEKVKEKIAEVDPPMAKVMVKECVYRGFCPEMKSCGYVNTEAYKKEVEQYRNEQQ